MSCSRPLIHPPAVKPARRSALAAAAKGAGDGFEDGLEGDETGVEEKVDVVDDEGIRVAVPRSMVLLLVEQRLDLGVAVAGEDLAGEMSLPAARSRRAKVVEELRISRSLEQDGEEGGGEELVSHRGRHPSARFVQTVQERKIRLGPSDSP